jgi:multidrug efflux pump subunit AcrB
LNQLCAIQKRNQRYTVGSNNDMKNEKTIVVLAKFDQAQAAGDVIIKSSFDGPVVRLRDIASINNPYLNFTVQIPFFAHLRNPINQCQFIGNCVNFMA